MKGVEKENFLARERHLTKKNGNTRISTYSGYMKRVLCP